MIKPYFETKLGKLYHGDCSTFMDDMILDSTTVDLVLTDPPYGIGEAAGKNKSRSKAAVAKDYGNLDWDNSPPDDHVIYQMRTVGKHQIIFGGNYFDLPPTPCWIVWDKLNGNNDFADCELAWTNFKTAVRKIDWRWAGMLQGNMKEKETRVHPTQKPVAVMKWIIERYSKDGDTIMDPFLGSGTTALACEQLNRKWVGIEREEQYCEIVAKRLSEPMQKSLFV